MLRTAIAAVFGFMSLVHGPVMTFAKAAPARAHHVMNAGGPHHGIDHDHHAAPVDGPSPAEPASAPVCYAFGCFIGSMQSHQARPPQASARSARCFRLPQPRCSLETSSLPFLLPVSTLKLSNHHP